MRHGNKKVNLMEKLKIDKPLNDEDQAPKHHPFPLHLAESLVFDNNCSTDSSNASRLRIAM